MPRSITTTWTAHTAMVMAGKPRHAYLSFPSAKSGDDRFHTAEIIALVHPDAFNAWRGTVSGHRGTRLRRDQGTHRARPASAWPTRRCPGFSALVQYSELSTPLTVEHFTSHPAGCFYGLPCEHRRDIDPRRSPRARRSPGLYLSGSDVASLGIPGAMMGGLAAASKVLGPAGFLRIMATSRRAEDAFAGAPAPCGKKRAVLVAKTALTPSIWRLEFELDEPIRFVPGQYAKLRVAQFEWRDYSIAAASGKRLTLLISNRTHGDGSNYANTVQPGAATEIELPLGSYHLLRNVHRKVFVATGTGLAPFLPMFEQMAEAGELGAAELYFGCRTSAEDITAAFAGLPEDHVCVSREQATPGRFQGRVTQALAGLEFDPATTDFYVCGSAAMVADCRTVLERAGAPRILTEPY